MVLRPDGRVQHGESKVGGTVLTWVLRKTVISCTKWMRVGRNQ